MSVMRAYTENWGRGASWDELPMIPGPAGAGLGQTDIASLLSEVTTALSLRPLGVVTPWAGRTGDMSWEEISRPDTNIALYAITDDQIAAVPQITFGSPLPFVAVLTKAPLTQAQLAAMWDGTAYEQYQTQAVYSVDDAKPVPTILFLHWGSRADQDTARQRTLALGPRVSQYNGTLAFAAQIPFQPSAARTGPPPLAFDQALMTQMVPDTMPVPAPLPLPAPDGTTPIAVPGADGKGRPPVPAQTNWPLAIGVGVGAGALAFFFWRKR